MSAKLVDLKGERARRMMRFQVTFVNGYEREYAGDTMLYNDAVHDYRVFDGKRIVALLPVENILSIEFTPVNDGVEVRDFGQEGGIGL